MQADFKWYQYLAAGVAMAGVVMGIGALVADEDSGKPLVEQQRRKAAVSRTGERASVSGEDELRDLVARADDARQQGNLELAEKLFEKVIALIRRDYGDSHILQSVGCIALGNVYSEGGKYALAEKAYRDAKAIMAQNQVAASQYAEVDSLLATAVLRQDRWLEAEDLVTKAITGLEGYPADAKTTGAKADAYGILARCKFMRHLYDETVAVCDRGIKVVVPVLGANSALVHRLLTQKGEAHLAAGKPEEGKAVFDALLEELSGSMGAESPKLAAQINVMGSIFFEHACFALAAEFQEKAKTIFAKDPKNQALSLAVEYDAISSVYEQNLTAEADARLATLRSNLETGNIVAALFLSRYLRTVETKIVASPAGSVARLVLAANKHSEPDFVPVCVGNVLETTFDNPVDPSVTYVVDTPWAPSDDKVEILSPVLAGYSPSEHDNKYSLATVRVYSDATKSTLISVHRQLLRYPKLRSQPSAALDA